MEVLSSESLAGLKELQDGTLSDSAFGTLAQVVFGVVLRNARASEAMLEGDAFAGVDQGRLKALYASLMTLAVEAAKTDAEASDVVELLTSECGFSDARGAQFGEMFGQCKAKLRAILGATGFALPQIVDSTWRLDYQLATSSTGRARVPVYLVKLSTLEKDGTPSEIEFTCTLHQLQDFLGKTKDACKQLERILKPSRR
jgi:hypothetical protein|tara:strand:+ start:117 stop:716 length:600 start_codon:yes stop_codon:yes gene_type:complete